MTMSCVNALDIIILIKLAEREKEAKHNCGREKPSKNYAIVMKTPCDVMNISSTFSTI